MVEAARKHFWVGSSCAISEQVGVWIPKNIYSWWTSFPGTSCALKHLLNLVGPEDLSRCVVGGKAEKKSNAMGMFFSSHSNPILCDRDTRALFSWQFRKKGMSWNRMIILSEMLISFRALLKSEMILVVIIMLVHMAFVEVKPPKCLINGRRHQLPPCKAAGLLELRVQECSLWLHTSITGSRRDAAVSFPGRQTCLRNLTLPPSFLQDLEKINKA